MMTLCKKPFTHLMPPNNMAKRSESNGLTRKNISWALIQQTAQHRLSSKINTHQIPPTRIFGTQCVQGRRTVPVNMTEQTHNGKKEASKVTKSPGSENKAPVNKDPLHGVTLKMMLEELQQSMGWQGLSEKVNINCFKSNPSIKSSLTFLRRTPWAREKVENLYLRSKGHHSNLKRPKKSFSQGTESLRGGNRKPLVGKNAKNNPHKRDNNVVSNPWLNVKK